jgi:ferredoxin
MAYIIAEPCIGVKDTACVKVCPVDYIDPDTCIDCGVCEPECPVTAIFTADDTPDKWRSFIEKNADYYKLAGDEFQSKWGSAGKE